MCRSVLCLLRRAVLRSFVRDCSPPRLLPSSAARKRGGFDGGFACCTCGIITTSSAIPSRGVLCPGGPPSCRRVPPLLHRPCVAAAVLRPRPVARARTAAAAATAAAATGHLASNEEAHSRPLQGTSPGPSSPRSPRRQRTPLRRAWAGLCPRAGTGRGADLPGQGGDSLVAVVASGSCFPHALLRGALFLAPGAEARRRWGPMHPHAAALLAQFPFLRGHQTQGREAGRLWVLLGRCPGGRLVL